VFYEAQESHRIDESYSIWLRFYLGKLSYGISTVCSARREKMATSRTSYKQSDEEKLGVDNVSSAMQHIFGVTDICSLDIADGLKQLLYEKKRDLHFLLQVDPASLAHELGIEEYIAKIIIGAAKKTTTK
jgi:hypothetical protein